MASSAASLVVSAVPVDVEDELEDEPEELLPEWLPARLPARLPACPSALSPVDVLLSASDDCVSLPVVVDEPPDSPVIPMAIVASGEFTNRFRSTRCLMPRRMPRNISTNTIS